MNILITGSHGFIGKRFLNFLDCSGNFCGQKPTLYQYNSHSTIEELDFYCSECDVVYHFAGVSRPLKQDDFIAVNFGLTQKIVSLLEKHKKNCPIVYFSSVHVLKHPDTLYSRSKLLSELLLSDYVSKNKANAVIYRLPNIFGPGSVPNYTSVVATFCYNISHNLPITINSVNTKLELVFVDDLIQDILSLIFRLEKTGLIYRQVRPVYTKKLIQIANLIAKFEDLRSQGKMNNISLKYGSFAAKLFATYISFLTVNQVEKSRPQ